jgi:hypothetical protein
MPLRLSASELVEENGGTYLKCPIILLSLVSFQYLEVSALYMARARAQIHFVMEPLTEIPEDLPIMDAVATEANDGTDGDKSMPED